MIGVNIPTLIQEKVHMSDVIELSNFIAGNWQPSMCGHWIEDISPATGEHIANIPCSSSEDIDLAVDCLLYTSPSPRD